MSEAIQGTLDCCAPHMKPAEDSCESCNAAVCGECFEDGADRGGDRRIGDLLTATPLLCLKCAVAVGTPR